MLLPAWWCSPQFPRFPSPVQHKDSGNQTALVPFPGYLKGNGHSVGDSQHRRKNGLSLAKHMSGGSARGEIAPVEKR